MADQQHTPGSWIVAGQSEGGRYITVRSDNGRTVARVPFSPEAGPYHDAADARLIATAPKLLAAAKLQHKAIDILMARLIAADPSFAPTKASFWADIVAGKEAIDEAEGR